MKKYTFLLTTLTTLIALVLLALLVGIGGTITRAQDDEPFPATQTPVPEQEEPVESGTGGLPWWNDRVFYEVFVRSFYDGDGDGTGDLQGLIDKLDYLNDGDPATDTDLGITGLWLMPVTQSPSYHGYDVIDYFEIESDYGTNEDFKQLIEEAHTRGIAVIVDLVLNHTSNQHPWFIFSKQDDSQYHDWYIWVDEAPTYTGPWGEIVWHGAGNDYYYGIFWEGMPDLNYRNPDVTAQMYEVIRFWLEDMNADGFRLDAIRHLIEDGEIQENSDYTHAWLDGFHRWVRSINPDALMVGEIWSGSYEVAAYVPDEVDIAFEFELAESMINAARRGDVGRLASTQKRLLGVYPEGQYATFLTNHDQNRTFTQLMEDVPANKVAATFLLTGPGVPFIYYGEEIGMVGAKPDERIRTPMQWDATDGTAGFTTDDKPWEPLADNYADFNVAAQTDDPGSLLSHYRALIHLRNEHAALRTGDLLVIDTDTRDVYSILRYNEDETLLVLVNAEDKPVSDYALTLDEGPLAGTVEAVVLMGEGDVSAPTVSDSGGFEDYLPLPELPAQSSLIIQLVYSG